MAGGVDRSLVERARSGESEARDELVRAAAGWLYPLAYRIVRDRDLADDAVQRTLVAIWRELPKLREIDRFEAWSYRILRRFCIDELKRHERTVGQELELDVPGPEDVRLDVGLRDQLQRAFDRLSLDHRAVVVLVYYQDLSGAEAARRLGISAGTVASRLHYALRQLRAAIEADDRGEPTTGLGSSLLLAGASR